jgi:hypothetical protein
LQELADIASQFVKARGSEHGAAQRGFAGLGIGGFAGAPALAGTVVGGRALNSLLGSNAARQHVLGANPMLGDDAMRRLTMLGKAAPAIAAD